MESFWSEKKFFRFFVIDGKKRGVGGGGCIRAILENVGGGVLTSARLTDTIWGGSGLRLVRRSGLTLVVGRHVTIGRVLFSDPIAFVDAVICRTYFNLMVFCFTWLWIVLNETSKKWNNGDPDVNYILSDLTQISKMQWHNLIYGHEYNIWT